jgi:hypothetical protein
MSKEEKVSFYDPTRNTYCDMPVSRVEKLIKEAKRMEKILAEKKDEK